MVKAATLDTFTLTGNSTSYNFQLPASGTPSLTGFSCPDPQSPLDFCYTGVSINNRTTNDTVEFFGADVGGGIEILSGSVSVVNLGGAMLFSGTSSAPTFLLGSFALSDINNGAPYTLDISSGSTPPPPSSIPEPSTWLLTGTGLAGVAARLRRRLKR